MPQQSYICPIAKLTRNALFSPNFYAHSYADKSEKSHGLHINLCGNTPLYQSQILLALAKELDKNHKSFSVFYDYFDSELAAKLEYGDVTVSGEKAGEKGSHNGQIEVNVSAGCDEVLPKLEESKAKMQSYVERLKAADFLNIASQARHSQNKIASKCFLEEKARAALERIARERLKKHGRTAESKGGFARQASRYTVSSAKNSGGNYVSPPQDYFPFFIKDKVFSLDLFMPLLCEILSGFDKTILLSEPLDASVCAVFVHDAKIAFVPYEADAVLFRDKHALDYKIINLERFCDTACLKQSKTELKFLRKCEQEFSDCALESLARANKIETEFYDAQRTQASFVKVGIEKNVSEIVELIEAHLMQKA